MTQTSSPTVMNRLVQRLTRLPGIGKRSAERMAFHLLKQPPEEAYELAAAITDLKKNTHHCSICFNLTDVVPCAICSDPRRDQGLVLVVEQPGDVISFETTGLYHGVYHVLMGRLSPFDGVGPGEINVEPLLQRARAGEIREVILGTQPTLEGDGTAMYLAQQLEASGVKVTRLARGIPTGASLETVSKAVLGDAIEGRRSL